MKGTALARFALAATLALAAPAAADDGPLGSIQSSEEDARVLHLLNRAAFGPSPASVEEVHRVGRGRWISDQIFGDSMPDPELDEKLSIYPALPMNSSELMANYPQQNRRTDEPVGIGPPQRVPVEVAAANLTRAVHGRAQIREVMTDFWFNHFNVSASEGFTRLAVVSYVRDAIRPHALGYFEDLLRATAESPAMLYYLDNYVSVAPGSRGRYSDINENYARELLELHTLGVDGGYTQRDVIEVARTLTGWTFTSPRTGVVEFAFFPRVHDRGPKQVLGETIPSGNQSEGLQVLHLLATHPSTAEFVSRKILQRLVADDPPQELVDRTAGVFLMTGGHIGWTVASVLTSDEFNDPAHRNNKAKTPLELVASALRATDADVTHGVGGARLVADLGQPMLRAPAPTGWPEIGSGILSPGGMVTRFDFGYLAATDRIEGARVDAQLWEPLVEIWGTDGLSQYLLGRLPGKTTRAALQKAHADGADPGLLAAIVLGSPEFQLQ